MGGGDMKPAISFAKSGIISINSPAVNLMGLKLEDKISFAQDDENPENWYLFIDEENGFQARGKEFDKTGCLCFNHNSFRRSFIESVGYPLEETNRFIIAGEPTKFGKVNYWGILIPTESSTEE